jgi:hypothetical protein
MSNKYWVLKNDILNIMNLSLYIYNLFINCFNFIPSVSTDLMYVRADVRIRLCFGFLYIYIFFNSVYINGC